MTAKQKRKVIRKAKGPAKPAETAPKPKPKASQTAVFQPPIDRKKHTVRVRSKAKYANDPSEPDRCHAGRKSDGKRCRKKAVFGRMVCKTHGGAEGVGAPIKHGLYSMANTRLGPIMDRVREQVDMAKDLDETLALACSMLQATLDRYAELDTPGLRKAALRLFDDATQAADAKDKTALLRELRALLARGVSEDGAMARVEQALERVQRFQNDYAKLELTANRVMNEKQLVAQFGLWLEIVAQEAGREVALAVASRAGLPSA